MLASNKGLLPAQTLISAVEHVAVPTALARVHHASGRWSDDVICNMPAGANFTKPADLMFDRVPDHLWSTGRAQEFTAEQMDRLRATLLSNKDAFCYSTADLKGYAGSMGDAHVTLQHQNKIFEDPRRHSPEHLEALDADSC